jgi:hypothetical protein
MAIAKVQFGPAVFASVSATTLTLPSGTTAGNLLVASLWTPSTGNTISGPSGWARAAGPQAATYAGTVEIWYLKNCGAGLTTFAFTITGSSIGLEGCMSEWSGADTVAPLDKNNSGQGASSTTTVASVSGAAAGALAITNFIQEFAGDTFTPGGSYLLIGGDTSGNLAGDWVSDYLLNTPSSQTETETSSGANPWAWAVATFAPPSGGGNPQAPLLGRNPLFF